MTEQYFKSLNYSLANEDTWPEVRLLRKWKPKRILSVAGSGGRSLPLLVANPEELHVVDLSAEQLWLGSLREETIRKYSHQDFLLFWGYPGYDSQSSRARRQEIFRGLDLSQEAGKYFSQSFEKNNWDSLLYTGKWERTFNKFSKVTRLLLGEKILLGALECKTTQEQVDYHQKFIPSLYWDLVFKVLGNAAVFNALLYKGHFVKKNVPESHFDYYKTAFSRIFGRTLLSHNFFAQLCFFGKLVTPEAIPVEGDPVVFKEMKEWLLRSSTVSHQGNILELVPQTDEVRDIDFFSFSDVPSYFEGEIERNFLQIIRPKMAIGGIVLVRNYLRLPEELDLQGYTDVTKMVEDEFFNESVQMYMVRAYRRES